MEIERRDFLNSPPVKSVRFGGSVSDILAKHKKVSKAMPLRFALCASWVEVFKVVHVLYSGRLYWLRPAKEPVGRPLHKGTIKLMLLVLGSLVITIVYVIFLSNQNDVLSKDAQIISWLQEIRSCVVQLNEDHEQLIYTVLVRNCLFMFLSCCFFFIWLWKFWLFLLKCYATQTSH